MKKLLRLFKRFFLILTGKDLFIFTQRRINTEKHGKTDATSWVICPYNLNQKSIIYSFGIGYDISFDLSVISRFNVPVYAFDPTPRSIRWLKEQELPDLFHYYEYGLADDGKADFFLLENPEYVSHRIINSAFRSDSSIKVQMYRLKTIMRQLHHAKIDLLKIDIEGAEYSALKDILNNDLEIDQILVEFHHRFKNLSFSDTKNAVNLLNSKGYQIFNVSISGEEISFIRN
jgi:FkbM family methyltransferase